MFRSRFSVILCPIIAVFCLQGTVFAAPISTSDAQIIRFEFIDNINCNTYEVDFRQFCKESKPKAWSEEEINLFNESLLLIQKKRLQALYSSCCSNGPIRLFRISNYGLNGHNTSVAFLGTNDIGITDHLFGYVKREESISHERLEVAKLVLHEIVHLYDYKHGLLSTSLRFFELTGWRTLYGRYIHNSTYVSENPFSQNSILFQPSKKSYRELGFPTYHSLTSPYETFADITVAMVLDPDVMDYLSGDIMDWVERNVLSGQPMTPLE